MERFKKLFLVLLLIAAFAFPSFASTLTVFAEDPIARVGAQISITNMPTEGEIGTVLYIPKGTSSNGSVITKIYGPKGTLLFDSSTDSLPEGANNTYAYTPLMLGTYKVVYAVISGDETTMASTTSNEFRINITGTNPTFEFGGNSNIILPNTTNYDYQIVVPYPTVYGSDGEVVALADVASNITITGLKPDSVTAIVFGDTTINSVNYKTFTPLEADGEGTYTINYLYSDPVTGLAVNSSEEVIVEASFDPADVELSYTLDGSFPESAVLGNEITLPSPVTRDSASGNSLLNTYVEVSGKFIDGDGVETDLGTNELNGFVFTPQQEGDYEITYTIYDFFSLIDEEPLADYSYNIVNVADTEAPTVTAVANYDWDTVVDDAEYDFVNVDYSIPSNVATNSTVYFPAIHGVDNYSLSSNLTYKRAIVSSNNTVTDLDFVTDNLYSYDETVPYTFTTEGVYTVKYYATDEAGNQKIISYRLEVVDGFVDDVAPRITLTSMPSYAKAGDTITFLKPTAIDYVSTTSTDTDDTRVELEVFYYLGDNSSVLTQILEDPEDSDYMSFVVPSDIEESYLNVLVRATDDGKNSFDLANVATKTKRIYVMDITDTVVPSRVGDEPIIADVDQDQVVTIPTIKITDNNPTYLSVTATVKDPNGNAVKVTGLTMTYEADSGNLGDADGIVVSGGKFTATLAGNYRILYTATDVAGNVYIKSYVQYINDTRSPSFQIESVPNTLELGETVTLPTPVIMDNGVEIENQAVTTIVFIDSPAYNLVLASYQFTPLEEGTYTFKYMAEDAFGNTSESSVYTITVADTIDPVLTLDDNTPFPLTAPLTSDDGNAPYDAIEIPGFIATDEYNGIEEYSVQVKNPNGEIILDAVNADGINGTNGNYSFVPTVDGTYTVTYSAVDYAGNETTDVRTIKVGDNAAPVITIGNVTANEPGNMTVGDVLTLDVDSITVADVKDGTIELGDISGTGETKFTIVLTGPDGSTISDNGTDYSYNLTQSGEYTLTYSAVDEAGNEKVETYVFQVSAAENNGLIITETWGIILIVVALLVLAGVVVYFIRSREIIKD
ncbi:MAG: Ig-like domain repeat protein [Spirochaetales bacterium]